MNEFISEDFDFIKLNQWMNSFQGDLVKRLVGITKIIFSQSDYLATE